ncbi:MAG TPA: TIM barrel protein [Chitinophagaceae bacterium]|nr:TIM barrel protein [Chitinophagaceae bacterium]
MIRRQFLKTSAMAVAGTMVLPELLKAGPTYPKKLVGLQLYSVRDDMGKDPMGTLKQLSDMGYRYAEHAWYRERKFYGWSAKEFKKILDDLGIKMPSGHTVFRSSHWDDAKKDFTDEWKYTVEDAAVLGQQYVISPSMEDKVRKEPDALKKFMDLFNKNGELCQKSGMKFGYHNHDFEFSEKHGDRTLFDIILSSTDPKLVMQQLDMGNLYNGGAKAVDIVNKYPGRFESWHVKDEITASAGHGEKYESTILGKGIVPVKDILTIASKAGGPNQFIIEQESYQGLTPLECMKQNMAIMKGWGYKAS